AALSCPHLASQLTGDCGVVAVFGVAARLTGGVAASNAAKTPRAKQIVPRFLFFTITTLTWFLHKTAYSSFKPRPLVPRRLCIPLVCGPHFASAPWNECLHPARRTMFFQFRFKKLVNRWILILIFDLMASLLLADSFGSPPRLVESVEASGHGKITGGSGSRVEVLMNTV